jgi:hypothetical protein
MRMSLLHLLIFMCACVVDGGKSEYLTKSKKMLAITNNRMTKERGTPAFQTHVPKLEDREDTVAFAQRVNSGNSPQLDGSVGLHLYVRKEASGPWNFVTNIVFPDDGKRDLGRIVFDGGTTKEGDIECELNSGAKDELHHWLALNVVFGQGLGTPLIMHKVLKTLPQFNKFKQRHFEFGYKLVVDEKSEDDKATSVCALERSMTKSPKSTVKSAIKATVAIETTSTAIADNPAPDQASLRAKSL